jgi:hypothetical protein
MQVMGFNRWEMDVPTDALIGQALKFAEEVEAHGIATLREAYIATDEKVLWCSWDAEDLDALQAAFDEMNRASGLVSDLTQVEVFYPR